MIYQRALIEQRGYADISHHGWGAFKSATRT
jgi:hypothetical protein